MYSNSNLNLSHKEKFQNHAEGYGENNQNLLSITIKHN